MADWGVGQKPLPIVGDGGGLWSALGRDGGYRFHGRRCGGHASECPGWRVLRCHRFLGVSGVRPGSHARPRSPGSVPPRRPPRGLGPPPGLARYLRPGRPRCPPARPLSQTARQNSTDYESPEKKRVAPPPTGVSVRRRRENKKPSRRRAFSSLAPRDGLESCSHWEHPIRSQFSTLWPVLPQTSRLRRPPPGTG